MTSFKKPLIAIASAVALVTSALVAAPANATISAALTVNTVAVTAAGTTADPVLIPVPADNVVDTEALAIVVTVAANTTVTATATGAKLLAALDTTTTDVNSGSGSATFSAGSGASGTTVTLYVYTTSTTAGSVEITVGGQKDTYYVKGTAGTAYNLVASAPTIVGLGVDVNFTANVTDVFGNAVTNASITTSVISTRATIKTALTYDATDKRYEGVITTSATASKIEADVTISATDVSGLAKSVNKVTFYVTAVDLAALVTAKDSEVAAANANVSVAEAKYAALVKRFNALAKQYNKKVSKKSQVKLVN